MSILEIEISKDLGLPPQAREILQKIFAGYQRIIIEKELEGGFSGSRVFVVRPFKGQHAELRAIIKIADTPLIERERHAYQTYIHNWLPKTSPIQEIAYSADAVWAGLRYPLIGDGIFGVESLYQYLGRTEVDLEKAEFTLERLFDSMGYVWRDNKACPGFSLQGSYDFLLPVNLVITPLNIITKLPPDKQLLPITPESVAHQDFRVGDYVSLEGFEVIKIAREKKK